MDTESVLTPKAEEPKKKSNWWWYALLIVALLASGVIGWYLRAAYTPKQTITERRVPVEVAAPVTEDPELIKQGSKRFISARKKSIPFISFGSNANGNTTAEESRKYLLGDSINEIFPFYYEWLRGDGGKSSIRGWADFNRQGLTDFVLEEDPYNLPSSKLEELAEEQGKDLIEIFNPFRVRLYNGLGWLPALDDSSGRRVNIETRLDAELHFSNIGVEASILHQVDLRHPEIALTNFGAKLGFNYYLVGR